MCQFLVPSCMCVVSHLVMPNPLWPQGLQHTRLLCLWNFPGKNTGMSCHFLLQGIFPTQGSNMCLLSLLYWQADSLPLAGSHHVIAKQMLSQGSQRHLAHFFMRKSIPQKRLLGLRLQNMLLLQPFTKNLNFTCSNIFQAALSTTSPCTENAPWKGQPNPKPLKNNSFSIRIFSSDNKQKQ